MSLYQQMDAVNSVIIENQDIKNVQEYNKSEYPHFAMF
jgi:hypothetical protein